MNSKTKRITHKIWAWILAVLTVLSSMTLMFPTIAEAATTSKIVSYWPSGGYSHHRFVVNGKDAFCINYGNASTGSFKKTSKTKSYYNKLGSGKQNKINQILTYAAKRGYLNYSGGGTITVSGNKLQKKDVYYSAIQRAIWQITDKSAANNGLSKWYKSVTKSAYNDIMNNYSKMLTADDVPSFKTPTLKESGNWGATVKDRNGILNSKDWKITSYSGLKSAFISGSSLKVYAKNYFSGNKTVKLASKYKVYDLDSSYAGIFGSQYAIMTAGGNKTLNASMSVKAQKPTPDPEPTPTQHFATIQVKKTDNSIPEKDRLTKEDIEQGTVTISNLGSLYREQKGFGTLIEIVPPQVCAFALGAVQDKPVVVTDQYGNKSVQIRQILPITIVFDHRALDFGDVVPFIRQMDNYLTNPEVLQEWRGQDIVRRIESKEGE